jgi:two-component system chemotaxis sensor kinase CheA
MTLSSLEKVEPLSPEETRKALTSLSQRVVSSDLSDWDLVLELAETFEKWTQGAGAVYGGWIEPFRDQARQITNELRSRQAVPKNAGALLRTLLQVHRLLDQELVPPAVPPEPEPVLKKEAPPPVEITPAPLPEVPFPPDDKNDLDYRNVLQDTLESKIQQMDGLLETLGEMTICHANLVESLRALSPESVLPPLAVRLDRMTRQVRDMVLMLRTVSVAPLFQKIARRAQSLSRQTGKSLEVVAEGGEVELDHKLVVELGELLDALLRNTLEHGIETPAERQKAAKPSAGKFKLKASHLGGAFILEVEDDGRGLDLQQLQARARDLGWIDSKDQLTTAQLTDFLFRAGFIDSPTSPGRGAGLEEIGQRVQRLKGSIRVQSQEGRGLKVILRLPKTLALLEGVLVGVGRKKYLLPMTQVRKIVLSGAQELEAGTEGPPMLKTPEGEIPIVDLNLWFREAPTGQNRVALQVESGQKRLCLLADEVLGKQQVMLKGSEEALESLPGVSGGAILNDGKIGLILDVNALMEPPDSPDQPVSNERA